MLKLVNKSLFTATPLMNTRKNTFFKYYLSRGQNKKSENYKRKKVFL